jgi:hypothetical protein
MAYQFIPYRKGAKRDLGGASAHCVRKNRDFRQVKEQFLKQLKVRQTIIFGIVFVKVVARHQLGTGGSADESRWADRSSVDLIADAPAQTNFSRP